MRKVTNEETTIYFSGSSVRAEKATGTGGASVWKLYLFAGGRLIGQRIEGATTTTTSYFINDHLDSLAVITDEMGAVKERLAYDPWGKRRYADGSDDPTWSITSESNRGFTGHEQMDEVGLVNMNARLYDPEVGRFVSPDPYIQSAEDSQSYNRYAYARNNPLSVTDPSGNFFQFLFIAAAAFAVSQLDFVQDLIQANPILGSLIQIAFAATGNIAYAALGAAAVTSAQGGDIGDIIKAAAIAAATAAAFGEIGDLKAADKIGFGGQVALHAAVGCVSAAAAGGKCAAGAAAAGFSAAAGSIIPKSWGTSGQLAAHSVIGGVASELGGGKFVNGAVTAAYGYIYNALAHPEPIPISDKERALAKLKTHEARQKFWTSRYERGDPIARVALGIVNDTLFVEGEWAGGWIGNRMTGLSGEKLNALGVDLMREHVRAVDYDFLQNVGNTPALLSVNQITRYHHKVFSAHDLSTGRFGGTPLGVPPSMTSFTWCDGCDPTGERIGP